MNIETLREISMALPGAQEDIKWEKDLCFMVRDKIFLFVALERVPTSASFKVPGEAFDEWVAKDGCKPAPYLARYKWVHIEDVSLLPRSRWEEIVRMSYDLIKSKLPKRVQRELGE